MTQLKATLAAAGVSLREDGFDQRLVELRRTYEPYVNALAFYFRFSIPPWIGEESLSDNWQTSIRERRSIGKKQAEKGEDEHF